MTTQTKRLVRETIDFYLLVPKNEKQGRINFIHKQLQQHKNGIENIGMGYSNDFVQGAEIFLRIYKTL